MGAELRIDRLAARFAVAVSILGVCIAATTARAETALSADDLDRLPIEDLGKIQISSVSKQAQPLSDAAAAIYVISHDDIARSGAVTIPEILRLAPNLFVAQTSSSQYVITARGFSGNAADQNFSDKLLVLIDGRSVYTPLYSGVYWDAQDVAVEDIDRIEVISGPGATLWGANAVNGVINIITRKTADTLGGVVDIAAGDRNDSISVSYGGRVNADLTYRLYVKDFMGGDTVSPSGGSAHDAWYRPQGGLRADWTPTDADTFTVQGDDYEASEKQVGAPYQDIAGRDLLARWTHDGPGGSNLQIQAYYDRTERGTTSSSGHFGLDTYDLDVQYGFALGTRQQVVVGGGYRTDLYNIVGTPTLFFTPSGRTLDLANVFAQDTISLTSAAKLVLGIKLEDDPYSGLTPLPNLRLSWKLNDSTLVWSAVSRAIRSPTPFDRDVREILGSTLFLIGGPNFQPESVVAYEVGARVQVTPGLSISVSGFDNVYDALRSIEFNPVTLLPLQFGNEMRGATYGVEIWGEYRVTPWWRLTASFDELSEHLKFTPASSALLGVAQAGDDPEHQASLRSSTNLGHNVTWDADLRYVSQLPDPRVPAYIELNSRVGWALTPRLRLSLSGFNLLHDHHQEFPAPQATAVPRSFLAGLQWRF